MIKKFIVAVSILLSGCSNYEYKGHYKFDESKIPKNARKKDIVSIFGNPLKFSDVDNVFYYVYSKIYRSSFGFDKLMDAHIVRIEFVDDIIAKCETINYKNFKHDNEYTKEPAMDFHGMFEIVHHIEKIANIDDGKKRLSEL